MCPRDNSRDPDQGEGDCISARQYNRDLRDFIDEGRVEAAEDARDYVERDPDDAARAENAARRGSRDSTVDDLISKGRSVVDRVRPMIQRASRKLRARLSHQRK